MFQLAPNNRDQADDVLLEDLRAVAARLGVPRLTRKQYGTHGRFAPATVANRFNGWGRALERAGLASARHFNVTKADALADLQRVARELGEKEISVSTYRVHGKFSEKPFIEHFGGWVNALAAAGLGVSASYNARISDEALLENLEAVWRSLGRAPTVNDMYPPRSNYSAHVYKRRFGGWRKALETFVGASRSEPPEERPLLAELGSAAPAADAQGTPRGSRSVGWRLRYKVLSRDSFACRACGRSPANTPGVVLEVDHVLPWSKGGPTTESNLQTLCEQCNGGKGAV
jgi:hypothetical protein